MADADNLSIVYIYLHVYIFAYIYYEIPWFMLNHINVVQIRKKNKTKKTEIPNKNPNKTVQ